MSPRNRALRRIPAAVEASRRPTCALPPLRRDTVGQPAPRLIMRTKSPGSERREQLQLRASVVELASRLLKGSSRSRRSAVTSSRHSARRCNLPAAQQVAARLSCPAGPQIQHARHPLPSRAGGRVPLRDGGMPRCLRRHVRPYAYMKYQRGWEFCWTKVRRTPRPPAAAQGDLAPSGRSGPRHPPGVVLPQPLGPRRVNTPSVASREARSTAHGR